jgi:integrase/recombinase XerD
MFETLFSLESTAARHRSGPFAAERERYLRHCSAVGAADLTQRHRAHVVLRIAQKMSPSDREGVDMQRLRNIIEALNPRPTRATAADMLRTTRPWLKFLGWWRELEPPAAFVDELDAFVRWMRDERGLAPCTIEQWRDRTATFLLWCAQTGRNLAALEPEDIDAYFATYGAGRWSRVSARYVAIMLRVFLRHAAANGTCQARLADSIQSPRRYRLDTLPFALGWEDVRRLIATAASESEIDVRDRAVLMLLAVYGVRRGEVAALRLQDIDFNGQQLRIWRLKRRQPQVYPLVPSVAKALGQYIDIARPAVGHAEVFIRTQAPRAPISVQAIYNIVARRLRPLGVELAHWGPHALRHACASKMLAEGLTLKEIGDHLGHRSAQSTAVYTKVDLAALRQVGEFDLGGLQ